MSWEVLKDFELEYEAHIEITENIETDELGELLKGGNAI